MFNRHVFISHSTSLTALLLLISILFFSSVPLSLSARSGSPERTADVRSLPSRPDHTTHIPTASEPETESSYTSVAFETAIDTTTEPETNLFIFATSTDEPVLVPHATNADTRRIPSPEPLRLTLRELAMLQIAAHDLFNMDRETELDTENGLLDLSTLFDHGGEFIALGGEARNRENVLIFTVASEYGERYERYLTRGRTEQDARALVLARYHHELERIYKKLFGETFPEPQAGAVTMTENLALRTIHDFLPGTLTIGGEEVLTVDATLLDQPLSDRDLSALTSPLDGQLDEEFLDVIITIPPDMILHISLLERDSSFGEQFHTDHSFEHFLSELEDGRYDATEDVTLAIKTLFAKGLNFPAAPY